MHVIIAQRNLSDPVLPIFLTCPPFYYILRCCIICQVDCEFCLIDETNLVTRVAFAYKWEKVCGT